MEKDNALIQMAINILDNGKMMRNMVKDNGYSQMDQREQGHLWMEGKMEHLFKLIEKRKSLKKYLEMESNREKLKFREMHKQIILNKNLINYIILLKKVFNLKSYHFSIHLTFYILR